MNLNGNIQIISAPSILGLKPTGVEELSESLISAGLPKALQTRHPVIYVETSNTQYSKERDPELKILNARAIRDFSVLVGKTVVDSICKDRFPFFLGGDCSVLIGIMSALKANGTYGLIFLDAHADFYEPDKSPTGEVADMDLAIVTGRGPAILKNIDDRQPYVRDEDVIHVGQRDLEETVKYGSQDIRKTRISCYSLSDIKINGVEVITHKILKYIGDLKVAGFWIHFDTDVLSDEINPAVDYRIPDGLGFEQVEYLLKCLLRTGRMSGISVTIFNPRLDATGRIARNITESLGKAFN